MDFEKLFKELHENVSTILKSQLIKYQNEAIEDFKIFLENSKEKLKRWSNLLSTGQIDLDDFKWLVNSQKDMLVFRSLYHVGVSKVKIGKIKNLIFKAVYEQIQKTLSQHR